MQLCLTLCADGVVSRSQKSFLIWKGCFPAKMSFHTSDVIFPWFYKTHPIIDRCQLVHIDRQLSRWERAAVSSVKISERRYESDPGEVTRQLYS